jgi:chorismate dehydratase
MMISSLSLRPKLLLLDKIKVAAVSYLNTKPLLYGVKRHGILKEIDLIEDYPALIAQLLIDDKVDVGLVPVAVIPRLKEWHIVSDYCIGAEGEVASVCIFCEVPIKQVQKVYLDYQSRTSVRLAKVLLKEYWQQEVEFIDASGEDFRNEIKDHTAGVVIGDRALEQRQKSKYIYDLGAAWKQHTGLPFVFAAWIANKQLPTSFITSFNEANKIGIEKIDDVIKELNFDAYDLKNYFTKCISYNLTDEKRKGLNLFLQKIQPYY